MDEATEKAYQSGRNIMISGFNHLMRVMWQMWKKSENYKLEVMKAIYVALNARRPTWMSEIIINSWEA